MYSKILNKDFYTLQSKVKYIYELIYILAYKFVSIIIDFLGIIEKKTCQWINDIGEKKGR